MIHDVGYISPIRTIRRFAFYVLVGLGIALAYHAVLRIAGFDWPWTSFLYQPQDRFNDWNNSVAQAGSHDPYFSQGTPALATYFPGAYLIFNLATGLDSVASIFLYFCIGEVLLFAAIFAMCYVKAERMPKSSNRGRFEMSLVLVLAIHCSYPALFALDRGNIDWWIACCCTLFVATQGTTFASLGLLALALSISFKGYPAAFLALYFARRDYRGAVYCIAVAIAISLAGLLTFSGGVAHNIAGLKMNLILYYERYVLGRGSLFASSDPYNAIRMLASILLRVSSEAGSPHLEAVSLDLLTIYNPFGLLFALVTVLFVIGVPTPAWRRVTAVCLVAILFPNVAADYKLCCLLPGLLLLLVSARTSRRETAAFGIFCLLMLPKSFYFIEGRSISMLINPVLLLSLAWQVMVDRSAWRRAFRLLPFRVAWYCAAMPGAVGAVWFTSGRRARFLSRDHPSFDLY